MSLNLKPTKCNILNKYAFHVYKDDAYILTLNGEKDLALDIEARLALLNTFKDNFGDYLEISLKKPIYFYNNQEALDYVSNLYSKDIMSILISGLQDYMVSGAIDANTTYIDVPIYGHRQDDDSVPIEFKFYNLLNNIKINNTEDNAFILQTIAGPNFIYNNSKLKLDVAHHLFMD